MPIVLLPVALDHILMSYDWPGNVRELENLIECALILHDGEPLHFDASISLPSKQVQATIGANDDETLELDALVKQIGRPRSSTFVP